MISAGATVSFVLGAATITVSHARVVAKGHFTNLGIAILRVFLSRHAFIGSLLVASDASKGPYNASGVIGQPTAERDLRSSSRGCRSNGRKIANSTGRETIIQALLLRGECRPSMFQVVGSRCICITVTSVVTAVGNTRIACIPNLLLELVVFFLKDLGSFLRRV